MEAQRVHATRHISKTVQKVSDAGQDCLFPYLTWGNPILGTQRFPQLLKMDLLGFIFQMLGLKSFLPTRH